MLSFLRDTPVSLSLLLSQAVNRRATKSNGIIGPPPATDKTLAFEIYIAGRPITPRSALGGPISVLTTYELVDI
jgi:hypothetical protein